MNNEILFKPNALITATNEKTLSFTNNEYKFFDMLLQRCQYNNYHGFRKAKFTIEDTSLIFKHAENTSVKGIVEILEKFKAIALKFKLNGLYVSSYAISQYTYSEEIGEFTCGMTDEVFKLLTGYNEYGYAPINLESTRKFKSFYSQRLYQLFRSWSKPNKKVLKEFKLSELKDLCDVKEGSSYNAYKIFKRDVLKKALKEINNNFPMEVEISKEIKVGRKIARIEFSILDHETKNYKFDKGEIVEFVDAQIIKDYKTSSENDDNISSEDYVQLIDLGIRESIHQKFINDFADYKEYLKLVEKAVEKTLDSIGGKTINTRNYKYFKAVLNNLMPTD